MGEHFDNAKLNEIVIDMIRTEVSDIWDADSFTGEVAQKVCAKVEGILDLADRISDALGE